MIAVASDGNIECAAGTGKWRSASVTVALTSRLSRMTHILLVPRRHIKSLTDLAAGDDALIGGMVRKARDLAREHGLAERGFRLVFNCGDDAGYSVHHIHLHLVGGRKLAWPPG